MSARKARRTRANAKKNRKRVTSGVIRIDHAQGSVSMSRLDASAAAPVLDSVGGRDGRDEPHALERSRARADQTGVGRVERQEELADVIPLRRPAARRKPTANQPSGSAIEPHAGAPTTRAANPADLGGLEEDSLEGSLEEAGLDADTLVLEPLIDDPATETDVTDSLEGVPVIEVGLLDLLVDDWEPGPDSYVGRRSQRPPPPPQAKQSAHHDHRGQADRANRLLGAPLASGPRVPPPPPSRRGERVDLDLILLDLNRGERASSFEAFPRVPGVPATAFRVCGALPEESFLRQRSFPFVTYAAAITAAGAMAAAASYFLG